MWIPNMTWSLCHAAAVAAAAAGRGNRPGGGKVVFELQYPQGSAFGSHRANCGVWDHGRVPDLSRRPAVASSLCAGRLSAHDELLGGHGVSAVYAACDETVLVSFRVEEGHVFLARACELRGNSSSVVHVNPELDITTLTKYSTQSACCVFRPVTPFCICDPERMVGRAAPPPLRQTSFRKVEEK